MTRGNALRVSVLLTLAVSGCGIVRRGKPEPPLPPVHLIAVLPVVDAAQPPQPKAVTVEVGSTSLPPEAARVVTAQIYGVMANSPQWRFVPDLVTAQALHEMPAEDSLVKRALALGKAVGADSVLYGTVSRYRDRQGTELGAREPASVSFRLALLSVASGKTVWTESFDRTQQALSSNLFDWWMFWRAGPHWFSAQELTRLGVEKLLGDLRDRLEE